MKTKISVDIHKNGSENDLILRLIANVNEGKATIKPEDIEGYLLTRKAIYPTISDYAILYGKDGEMNISEDNLKSYTLTLRFKEVYELNESEENLLIQEKLS